MFFDNVCLALPDGRMIAYDRDALGRITAKRINGAVVKGWIYKDGLKPIAETDPAGNVVSFFVYGSSPLTPDYMTRDGNTYRLIRDHVGSVRLAVDINTGAGAIAQRIDYDSFGNVLADTNPGFQPFGFQSGLYDNDTGFVQFGLRWYDPLTGRWLSKDPILLSGGLNVYAFCANDPINFIDPFGLYGELVHWYLTRLWATQAGVSSRDAWLIAEFDQGMDEGALSPFTIEGNPQHFKNYPGNRKQKENFVDALHAADAGDIWEFSQALHAVEDTYAHANWPGFHLPEPFSPDIYDPTTKRDQDMQNSVRRLLAYWNLQNPTKGDK